MAQSVRITTRVEGVQQVIAALRGFRLKARDLRDAWADIGAKVKTDAKPLVNTQSGDLAASIRSGRTKTRAVVRAGNSKVLYAGVNHYGNYTPPHAHSEIQGNEFLVESRDKNMPYAIRRVKGELTSLIYKFRLN